MEGTREAPPTFENILAYPENYTVEEIRGLEVFYRDLAASKTSIKDKIEPLDKASKLNVVAIALEAKFLERKFDPPLRSSESDEIGIGGILVLETRIIENIRERSGKEYKKVIGAAGLEFIIEGLKESSEKGKTSNFIEEGKTRAMFSVNKTLSNGGDKVQRKIRFDKIERLFDSLYGAKKRKSSLLYVGEAQMINEEAILIRIPINHFTISRRYETFDIQIDDPDRIIATVEENIDKLIRAFQMKLCG